LRVRLTLDLAFAQPVTKRASLSPFSGRYSTAMEHAARPALPSPEELSDPPSVPEPAGRIGAFSVAFEEYLRRPLPRWALLEQHMDAAEIGDVGAAVKAALDPVKKAIAPGSRVCLTVGSRGIDRIDLVVKAAVEWCRGAGFDVFIVPAMGSHGGATAAGQLGVLASLGITPESAGCEIRSSMEAANIGEVRPGVPAFVDKHAFEEADAVIPINRVKPHTDFSGEIESGLMKMIAIGIGKQQGADTLHRQGFATFRDLIPQAAEFIVARANIPFGLALIENGYARLSRVEAVAAAELRRREIELLVIARDMMPRLPFAEIDVLILDYIGKDVSGLGMDSNVVGRYYGGPTDGGPSIQRIMVRDLTDATDGNAVGIGLADVVLERAVRKMDAAKTYMNSVTAKTPGGSRIPITMPDDRTALAIALACCVAVESPQARIVRVPDTKHLDLLWVSEPAIEAALKTGRCEVVRRSGPIVFDGRGMFADGWDRLG
jgi:hypothetical protein